MVEDTFPVQLATSDVQMLLAVIEYRLEVDASLSNDERNDLEALFQHLENHVEV